MKKQLLTTAVGLTALVATSQVVPSIDWVKYKSDRSQISNVPSAIDANNNAFITGYMFAGSNANAVTVKYDPLGNELFSASYDNGGFDNSKAIVLDAAGNSYVTGESDGTGTGRDIITVKYNPSGTQLWAMRFNGTANANDVGNSILVDPSGNVYVTGYTTNAAGNRDYVTIKYNANGVQQFAVTFAGAGNQDDEAVAVAFNNNRLYITGTSINASGNSDIVTLRINPNNGNTVWTKSENGTANTNDVAFALLAYNNDVVVVGQINNTTTGSDYVTAYYNGNNGSTSWRKLYDFANTQNFATALCVDASGNFAVTGIVNNAGLVEYHTVLYNTAGVQQWSNKVATNLLGVNGTPQIAVDPIANHFYVSGSKLGVGSDILVYQITPSGNKTWEETFNGAQNSTDAAVDLVVNSSGVIYVAGASLNSSAKYDYTTIRISQTPVMFPPDLVATNNDKSFLFYENIGQELDINKNKLIDYKYITHTSPKFYIKPTQLSMVFASGSDTNNIVDTIHRIDIDFYKANLNTKVFSFEEYGSNISYLLGQLGAPATNQKGNQRLMIPNLYPNIDLHYYSNRNGGLKYYFVIKPGADPSSIIHILNSANYSSTITPGGSLKIISSVGETELQKPICYQVNILSQTVPLSGASSWSALSNNSYKLSLPNYNPSLPLIIFINQLAKQSALNSSNISIGNLKWSTFIGGESDDQAFSVAIDKSGNQHVAGSTSSINFPILGFQVLSSPGIATNSRYGFYCKFDSLHDRKIFAYIGGNDQTDAYAVSTNNNNDAYIIGTTQATDFLTQSKIGAYNDNTIGSTAGNTREDCFIVKFNSLEQYTWGTYFGGTNNDQGRNCTIDGNNNLYLTGGMRSVAMPLVPNGNAYQQNWSGASDCFIGKFNTADSLIWFTYYGGATTDAVYSCKTNSNNDLYLTGFTYSSNFPTFRQNSSMYKDSTLNGLSDLFILKFNSAGVRQWATLYGGSNYEYTSYLPTNNCIGFDASQNVYIAGGTESNDFFTKKLSNIAYYDSTFGGNIDAFLLRFSASQQLQFSTYIGGNKYDVANSLTVDNNNNLYLNLGTGSSGLNTNSLGNSYLQSSLNNATPPINIYAVDNFILSLNPNLSQRWATYFGGSSYNAQGDEGMAVALDKNKMYIAGYCNSYNSNPTDVRFPIFYPGAPAYIDSTYNDISQANSADAFISLFDLSSAVNVQEISNNKKNQLLVFPNPSNNNFNIQLICSNQEPVKLSLYNIEGKLLFQKEYPVLEGNNIIPFYTNGLPTGIYLLNLKSESFNSSVKLIKNE